MGSLYICDLETNYGCMKISLDNSNNSEKSSAIYDVGPHLTRTESQVLTARLTSHLSPNGDQPKSKGLL